MTTFLIIWLGQLVSLVGSGLTGFALGVYVYQQTGSTTPLMLVWLFVAIPNILVSPLAGALVDRWDRRWVMVVGDIGAALSTLAVAALLFTDRLEVWHIYLAATANTTFGVFQGSAYSASITLLVPKKDLGRANGLTQTAYALSNILAPLLAGVLVVAIGLGGVILIDVATFVFAIITLLFVRIPRPKTSPESEAAQGSLLREAAHGWKYVTARPGLLGLVFLAAIIMVLGGTTEVLITPLVLSFSSAEALGLVLAAGGVGVLVGGLVMSAWGGPERRVNGIVLFEIVAGTCTLVAGLYPSVALITASVFLLFFTFPILDACEMAIWQTKVPPDMQGRVFSMRRVISWLPLPLALLATGPLVDHVLEPLLSNGGALAGSVGRLIGTGPGRGIGLLFIVAGALNVLAAIGAYVYPRIRYVEDELLDVIPDEPDKDEVIVEGSRA